MFPCGSRYGQDIGAQAMQGDIGKARAMLAALFAGREAQCRSKLIDLTDQLRPLLAGARSSVPVLHSPQRGFSFMILIGKQCLR